MLASVVLTIADSARTATVSLMPPSANWTSPRDCMSTRSSSFSTSAVRNPLSSILSV